MPGRKSKETGADLKNKRQQLKNITAKAFLHPDGEYIYTRMEKSATPGWRRYPHPGGATLLLLPFKRNKATFRKNIHWEKKNFP